MKEFEIETFDDLLSNVEELTLKHDGARIWFRGQADSRWALVPSIQRDERYIFETNITNDFYIKSKQVLKNSPAKQNYSAWLSLMQHYGLPTRLLDWSLSPLIAAFFATEKYSELKDTDACIWVLFPGMLNMQEGFGDYMYPNDAYTIQEMLVHAFKKGYKSEPKFDDKVIACCSTENDLRMYSQQSTFTVHNSQRRLIDICSEEMLYKMIIPSKNRKWFFDRLDSFGINKSFIYPDIEHIANDIKGRYRIPNRYSECKNYNDLLKIIISELTEITKTDYNQIILLAKSDSYTLRLVVFADKISHGKQCYRIVIQEGIIFDAYTKGSIVNVKDIKENKEYYPAVNETKSELAVPISTIGVFNSESDKLNYFTDDMIYEITLLLRDFYERLLELGYRPGLDMKDIPYVTETGK